MEGLLIFEGVRREEVNGGVEGIEWRDYGYVYTKEGEQDAQSCSHHCRGM